MQAFRSHRMLAGLLVLALGLFSSAVANAQDKKVDVTGQWKWTMQGRQGGQGREVVLTLKQEGDKVTGSLPGRGGGDPVQIENGKIAGDTISFTVTREFNGNKFTQKYSGKVDGDTIKGKIESERDGQTNSRDWEAKREKKSA